ncbi:50S ribosomal protein L6 [Desulfoprunum benzoelyticum]|uniref:Large ribosomal subunit protein uL6 n=1 Tax=Desulfoprunum benzoelyticum TaxID=1506996 RepID=A0A840V3K9_9BACT|nr:50S ribosomal protein L6 [Desulfoprunum benzoelyticum]MBB5348329.1 large subunit ribosomal protein L6 [Desulfoprunum benzoelyticum]MBM9528812.1 50S ribosomal protein L6 [Desulfoprunum benzoelyticum]
MSRIGKQPITVPAGVKVDISGQLITVTGKKGKLVRTIQPEIEVVYEGNVINIINKTEGKTVNAFRGLTRSLVNNMVVGVEEGFKKVLVIEGVGYKANVVGNNLTLNVGYSSPVEFTVPSAVTASIEGNNKVVLESIDKELLGLIAAKIRQVRKPEPYKGKGIRYEGEHIVRKVGKSGSKK